MENIGIACLALVVINCIVSYNGIKDLTYFYRYCFGVDEILIHKDYKRLITSGFLHLDWMHLLFNMFSLMVFSGLLEAYMGPGWYLLIFFASLIGGNLFCLLIHRNSPEYRAAGASGAVCGIIFSSIALFPGMQISLLILPVFIPSWLYGILFVLYSVYGIRTRRDNIGHEAHLGGALVGMILAIILYPQVIYYNYLPIILITVPSIVLIYILIKRPGSLWVDNVNFIKLNSTLEDR